MFGDINSQVNAEKTEKKSQNRKKKKEKRLKNQPDPLPYISNIGKRIPTNVALPGFSFFGGYLHGCRKRTQNVAVPEPPPASLLPLAHQLTNR